MPNTTYRSDVQFLPHRPSPTWIDRSIYGIRGQPRQPRYVPEHDPPNNSGYCVSTIPQSTHPAASPANDLSPLRLYPYRTTLSLSCTLVYLLFTLSASGQMYDQLCAPLFFEMRPLKIRCAAPAGMRTARCAIELGCRYARPRQSTEQADLRASRDEPTLGCLRHYHRDTACMGMTDRHRARSPSLPDQQDRLEGLGTHRSI